MKKTTTLLLIILLLPNTIALTTNKENYIQGETITITTNKALTITTPTSTYTLLGTGKNAFPATEPGTYTLTTNEETKNIEVTPGITIQLRTNKGASTIHAKKIGNNIEPIIPGIDQVILKEFTGTEIKLTPNLGNKYGWKRTYAIDPRTPGFTEAELTLTATGNSLYKCIEYNYESNNCYGSWEYQQQLTPGEQYTITVTETDPIYGEGDTESQPDKCQFSDEVTYGDGDNNEDCLTEVTTQNDGTTTDIEDYEVGTGTSEILINWTNTFSITSINAINVTYRYQRVPSTEVGDTTATIQVWDAGGWTTVTACTDTAVNDTAWETNTCDIGGFVTTPVEANNVRTRVLFATAKAAKGSSLGTVNVDYAYLYIDFVYNDTKYPSYTNIDASPPSPKTYTPEIINFSVDWNDDIALANVSIEHNFTTTLQNTSLTGGTTYLYQTTLGVGTYIWRQLANDTSGNLNDTMPYQNYIVTRANGAVELLMNYSGSNAVMYEDTTIDINGTLLAGETDMFLYENGAQIGTGTDIDLNRFYGTPGTYTITLNISETQNYTFHEEEYNITVLDKTPPQATSTPTNQSAGTSWIYWTWSNPPNPDFSHVIVEYNGTFYENTSNTFINITGLDADTEYEIQLRTVDTSNNINESVQTDLGRTKTSADVTPPKLINIQLTSITDSQATITWTTDEPADTLVKYGTSTGTYTFMSYDATDTTNHNRILANLLPSTNYYYVVNSTDAAGNTNQSIEYMFTTTADTTPPKYSNIETTPTSGSTYPVTTEFNVTWIDNGFLANISIEHNFSGTWKNDTMTGTTEYTYSTSLGAGKYNWRSIANDTSGNLNNTMPYQTYIVNQATGEINLYLNGTDGPYQQEEDTIVNLTGDSNLGEGLIEILRNGTPLGTGTDPYTLLETFYEPGTYNITARMNETQNYTAAAENHTLTITDATPPNITLTHPDDGDIHTSSYVDFQFIPEDNIETTSCTLYLNEETNTTNTTITDGTTNFIYETLNPGDYNWTVGCTDAAGNEKNGTTRSLTIEIIYPWIPTVATHSADGDVTIDVNVSNDGNTRQTDNNEQIEVTAWNDTAPNNINLTSLEAGCEVDTATRGATLYFQYNTGGGWSGDLCGGPQDGIGTFTCDLYSQGVDNVTELNNLDIRCVIRDNDGGPGAQSTIDYIFLQPSWELLQYADFNITAANITTPTIKEGRNGYIYARIQNDGTVGANAVVRFRDERTNTTLGEPSELISAGTYVEFNTTWTANIGRTNITVFVDPLNIVDEEFENNNKASVNADINSTQIYYGEAQQGFTILGRTVGEQYNWSINDITGNIFVVDQDADVDFLQVQALTRTAGGILAFEDLGEADARLGQTFYVDNLNNTYSSGGSLLGTRTYTVFGDAITNVPVIDSTEGSSFQTGILYDLSDDTNGGYDGEEDLIFITEISQEQLGAFGTYDYEIQLPALLRNESPSIDIVELYIEIT